MFKNAQKNIEAKGRTCKRSCTEVERCLLIKPKSTSINALLLFLGARWEDVYRPSGKPGKRKTIYDRYSLWELEQMAQNLYKEALIKNHPDTSTDKEASEEMCKKLSMVYCKIKKILKYR